MAIDIKKVQTYLATKTIDDDTKADAVGASHALDNLRALFYGTEFEEKFSDVIQLVDAINDSV